MRITIIALAAAGVLGASGYGLYRLGLSQGMHLLGNLAATSSTGPQKAGDIDPATGKRVLYWHDPMVPSQKFDRPGKSPFMDMQLEPVYAEASADAGDVSISPSVQQNLGIRLAEAVQGTLAPTVEAVGSVDYNERDVTVVQARSSGYVEKLYVRAPLDPVRKGQPLAELYVPDWVAAQEEYFSVRQMALPNKESLAQTLQEGARQRMRLAGMTEEQIRKVEASGKVEPRITVIAPSGGVVAELGAREGMTVAAGAPMFRINGLSTVWVNAEIPESVASQVKPGDKVEAHAASLPGITFNGHVNALLPEVNPTTRTLKARIELANKNLQLVPGMFVNVSFAQVGKQEAVLVPSEAIIQTGKRSVVIVAQDGKFAAMEVQTGAESNSQTEVLKGLTPGQKVVASGQFLIDSEASLKGTIERMEGTAANPSAAAQSGSSGPVHHGQGKVEDIHGEEITISHGPIPTLQWGAMTMGFKASADIARGIAVGDTVAFDIREAEDGAYEIVRIEKVAKP